MTFNAFNKVPIVPSNPHGYLTFIIGYGTREHTPTGSQPLIHKVDWFSENSAVVPVSHPCLTMGAVALYLLPQGRLIDPFLCTAP